MLLPGFQNIVLLVLRLAVAAVFFAHGISKVKNWKTVPAFMRFIGVCEVLGSIATAFGLLTQVANMGFAIIMLGAMYMKMKKWHVPFTSQQVGWEFELILFAAALTLAFIGAGTISVDSLAGLFP